MGPGDLVTAPFTAEGKGQFILVITTSIMSMIKLIIMAVMMKMTMKQITVILFPCMLTRHDVGGSDLVTVRCAAVGTVHFVLLMPVMMTMLRMQTI